MEDTDTDCEMAVKCVQNEDDKKKILSWQKSSRESSTESKSKYSAAVSGENRPLDIRVMVKKMKIKKDACIVEVCPKYIYFCSAVL